jgi:AcrR family transcriptional regulator
MSPLDPPRTLREEQKAFTRRRLVDAAVEVFAATGYTQATIEDITNAAGASRATFYLHFKSKAEIVKVLLTDELLPDSDAIYENLRDVSEPTWDVMRVFVAQLLKYWDHHRPALDILQQAYAADREEIGEDWAHALLDTAELLAQYMTRLGGVEPELARVRAMLLIGLADRYHFFSRLPGFELDRESVLDALTDIWTTAFRAETLGPEPALASASGA